MENEIILKFKADNESLNNSFKDLETKANKIETEISNTFKTIAKESGGALDPFIKDIDELAKDIPRLKELAKIMTENAKSLDKNSEEFNTLNKLTKEFAANVSELEKTKGTLKGVSDNIGKATESTKSLRTQMREAQMEVATLSEKFGATSREAIEAAKRAAVLKDTIGDAKALTDAFNPDAKFRSLTASVSGVVGGFQAYEGALALIGVESEDLQKTLVRLNGIMALSQGLQALGESKDSFMQLGAVIKSQVITAFTTLRGAIIATGIGALVVGLGLVISNFDKISAWIKSSPLGAFANQVGNLVEKFTDFVGITSEAERASDRLAKANSTANKQIENRIKLLKAQGGSEKEIATLQKQAIQNDIDVLNSKKSLSEEELQTKKDLQNELLVIDAEYSRKQIEEAKKRNEEAKKRKEEALKQERELEKRKNEIAFNAAQERQKILDEIENANYKNEYDRERQQIRDEFFLKIERNKELEAELIKIREAKIAEIDKKEKDAEKEKAKSKIENEKKIRDENNKIALKSLENELLKLSDTEIESRNKLEKKISDLKISQLENEKIETIKNTLLTETERALIILEIDQEIIKLKKDARKKQFEEDKAMIMELSTFAQNGILLQLGLDPQSVERVKQSLNSALDTFNETSKKLEEGLITQSKANLQRIQAVAEVTANAIGTIGNALFSAEKQRLQEQSEALNAQQEEELRLAGDNEQKKEVIRQKYDLRRKELKRKEAEADKRAAIFQATINGAQAIASTLGKTGFFGIPLAAIVAGLVATQIALIAAQPIPKFEKGGQVKDGLLNGKPHSAGGIHLEAEGGEYIINKRQTKNNLGLIEAVNMSDADRDKYINGHYILPALKAQESEFKKQEQARMIEIESLIASRIANNTLKGIHSELKETTNAVRSLKGKGDIKW